jgi:outer membrane immunogenic protein
MRRLLLAGLIAVAAQGAAQAADPSDLPILRGSFREAPAAPSRTIWQGVYVGAHYGYSSHDYDFSNTTVGLQQFLVRESIFAESVGEWQLLGTANTRSSGFGGFVGYNAQYEDAVIGLEANYTRFAAKWANSAAALTRVISNPDGSNPPAGHTYEYNVTLSGDASARVNDLVTLRARGGWSMGSFMPYGFVGLAAALVDIDRAATVTVSQFDLYNESVVIGFDTNGNPITTLVPRRDFAGTSVASKSESQKNLLTFGFAAGLGFEYMLLPSVFLRAEYEYVQLTTAKDTIIQLNTGRVGIGAKF